MGVGVMIRRWVTYTIFWLCGNADDNLYGFDDLDSESEDDAAWGAAIDDPIPYVLAEHLAAVGDQG
jgi:hypothetical protein